MKLEDFIPGMSVVYQPYPGGPYEDGTVVSVGERWVFVHYRGDAPDQAKATAPEMLTPLR